MFFNITLKEDSILTYWPFVEQQQQQETSDEQSPTGTICFACFAILVQINITIF